MRMFQVDAFTSQIFAGNPAAVLVLDAWLPDSLMLQITQENNLAETAFVMPRPDGDWDLRWFAPAHEVDFCGHATLATAHVLFTEYGAKARVTFHTRIGLLHVSRVEKSYQLDIPRLQPEFIDALPPEIAHSLAVPPVAIFRNFENYFADLGGSDAVRTFVPDLSAIALLGTMGFVVTGLENPDGKADFVSRYFAPGAGIPEDPVTGSIHATLVPYWAKRLNQQRLTSYQASARGGWLECQLADDRVLLVGDAVTFMSGHLHLGATRPIQP
jgi:PhzF family phenazine biosynthesis protein